MRKLLMVGAVLAAVAVPTTSHAQFTLGLRVGYAPAMGDGAKDQPMKDVVKSQIPIQLDAMYRITPEWSAGLYYSYGFGQLNSDLSSACDAAGYSCSLSAMRFGAQGTYTFTTASPTFVPWAGLGIGYESMTQKVELGGQSVSQDVSGWEFLNLQVGGDFKVSPQFAVGPYVMYSIGQYSSVEGNSITDKAMHEWLNFGVRGKFDL